MRASLSLLSDIVADLRGLTAPDALFGLAHRCGDAMSTSACPGTLLSAQSILLRLAKRLDGEPLGEVEWARIQDVAHKIAGALEAATPENDRTQELGLAWLELEKTISTH